MSGTYSSTINQYASQYGVPASLVKAVATQESGLGSGSQNIMQVNGMNNSSPTASIQQGTQMLAQYYKQTGGSVGWTLAMYNMGPGILNWAANQGIGDPATAMKLYSQYMQQHGNSGGYGDPNYITNVSRYLS